MTIGKKIGYILIGLGMGILTALAIIIVLNEPEPIKFIAEALHNLAH